MRDLGAAVLLKTDPGTYENYFHEILKLDTPRNYFNSGILLFNIKKCIDFELTKKCLRKLEEIKNPLFVDQCIFNAVCEHEVELLHLRCNAYRHLVEAYGDLGNWLPEKDCTEYMGALDAPIYIHFSGGPKPWYSESVHAFHFWQNARNTPFYEDMLARRLDGRLLPLHERLDRQDQKIREWDARLAWSRSPGAHAKAALKLVLPRRLYLGLKNIYHAIKKQSRG